MGCPLNDISGFVFKKYSSGKLGTMDYQTIMKLSSHRTFSQFSKYVSVINEDLLKSRKLYSLVDDSKGKLVDDKMMKEFKKLSEEQKKMILGVTMGINKT